MKFIVIFAVLSAALLGCGGGGGANASGTRTGSTTSAAAANQGASLCGLEVGAQVLSGLVTQVHDGDTLTLSVAGTAHPIRPDRIDAPELAQPFGSQSQMQLQSAVPGKAVKVAYSKTDQYDRIVGAVFTDSCRYINLDQGASGLAWFYKACQCEISPALRLQFAQAHNTAVAANLGLWVQAEPEAPWFYRNCSEPATPVCPDAPAASPTPTCYSGPHGGTHTITADGHKDYSGC
ncbi:MAG: thermonuclease family protein [Polaromonas sp.]|nr:thermonuclease family protein [Polaromonas sp.]